MRITKEPEERKQEILDTAMRLFYERGYEKTSIADIAKTIGVAQGLCNAYGFDISRQKELLLTGNIGNTIPVQRLWLLQYRQ